MSDSDYATYVDGIASDDYFAGTEPGLFGARPGFEAAAMIRFANAQSMPVDTEFPIFGCGDLTGVSPTGWRIFVRRFGFFGTMQVVFAWAATAGDIFEAVANLGERPGSHTSLFVHGLYAESPVTVNMAIAINGIPFWELAVVDDFIQLPTDAPLVGSGTVPNAPTDPHFGVSALAYREGYVPVPPTGIDPGDDFDNRVALAYRRAFQINDFDGNDGIGWDYVWSAKRDFYQPPEADALWYDTNNVKALQRTGGGDSMRVRAARPYWGRK